ncbi:MAG: cation diffusion facilitator family transporter [Verrucomicrobiia bacterium]
MDRNLSFSIGLNALIVAVEVTGGLVSGSLALLSDALHNLSDVVALALALVARKLGRRPNSAKHTYGLGRLEVLAAFFNSATLLIVSTLICREAVVRLLHPEPVRGGLMLTVAVVGLAANLVSVFLLKGHHHGDLNMRSAFLHLVQDTVSSVAVVMTALFVGWEYGPYLDPVVSILVVLLILRSGWGLLRDSARILLEGTPPGLDLAALQRDVQEHFAVRDLHHVHVWELNAGHRVLSAHVRLPEMPLGKVESLLARIREHLAHDWAIQHATLEPEVNGCGSNELIAGHKERQDETALALPKGREPRPATGLNEMNVR